MRRPPYLGLWVGLLAIGLLWLARLVPGVVETVYSRRVYPWIARPLATVTGWVPFALTEIVTLGLVALAIWLAVRNARRARSAGRGWPRTAVVAIASLLVVQGWVTAGTIVVYGFNLARRSSDQIWKVGDGNVGAERVEAIVREIGRRVDRTREGLDEFGNGVVRMPSDLNAVDAHLRPLQAAVLRDAGLPEISAGRVKRQLFGGFVRNYVSGYFSPQTMEPTVAWPPFPTTLPAIAAHERAHLSGFASEDEASFVGFLTTIRSDRPEVRYSGWLDLWLELGRPADERSRPVQLDIAARYEAFAEATGPAEGAFRQAHDSVLRVSGELRGLRTYSDVVARAILYLDRYGFPDQ